MKKWLLLGFIVVGGGVFALANLDPMLLQQERIQQEEKNLTQNSGFDLYSDDSLQRFLDEKHPFTNLTYKPNDLVSIESDFTSNNARKYQLRAEASKQFADLAWHFWQQNGEKKRLSITSAFRSHGHQAFLRKSCYAHRCATPGTSEHQAGLALDLGVNGGKLAGKHLQRMQENAHKRGFHQTYQKGIEIDGKHIEDWHWRYVGTGLATELWKRKMSFAEWFQQKNLEHQALENQVSILQK